METINTETMVQQNLIETREDWEILLEKIAQVGTRIDDIESAAQKMKAPLVTYRDELFSELKARCPHPQDKVITKSSYIEGSYLDQSQSTKWAHCTVCEQDGEKHTTFGGFA